jgi:hypothetical protein
MAFVCDSDRIQTCNLLIRSQMLYSVELQSRIAGAKISIFSVMANSQFLLVLLVRPPFLSCILPK